MVCGLSDGMWSLWWYMVFVMVWGLCDGMWSLWWYMVFLMVCGLCDGMWSLWWYMVFVMVCGLSDGMWSLWWYVVFLMVCGLCEFKRICARLYCLFIHVHVLGWRSRSEQLTDITPPHVCAFPLPGAGHGQIRGRRDRDYMVVGFITTCAISAYHH